jgi:hypothetical protein
MPFNIDTFKSDIEDHGYIKTNHFQVWVGPPPIFRGSSSVFTRLKHRIEQVRVPGINFMSVDANRYGVGPTQKQPYNAQFNEISFNLLCDVNGDVWQFWHDWLRTIYNFTPGTIPGSGQVTADATYALTYKEEYAGTVSIVLFNTLGAAIRRVDMYQAFPTSIREIPMTWEDQGSLIKLGVSMTYKEHTLVGGS